MSEQPPGGSTPGPYAGSPGAPMPAYDVGAIGAVGAIGNVGAPRDHQGAIVAFILGIFSVAGFAIVGPVAWVMASRALKEMDGPHGTVYTNRGLAVAAKVLGIIGTIFLVLGALALLGFAVFAVVAARSGSA